jgi:hypothetical protein
MRVRSAQPGGERSRQEKSPKRVRQPTPRARLRDQSHDSRTTRRVQDGGLAPSSHQAYKLTPLRVDKIVPILTAGFCSKAFPIYRCGAAKRQTVGPLHQ